MKIQIKISPNLFDPDEPSHIFAREVPVKVENKEDEDGIKPKPVLLDKSVTYHGITVSTLRDACEKAGGELFVYLDPQTGNAGFKE